MCGIVGMVSQNSNGFHVEHQKIFQQLLWADTVRGEDSTGIFGVNKEGNVTFHKSKGAANVMLNSKEYNEFNNELYTDFQMVVGHNRKATRGATTDENAHPFVEDTTILVHNGTLFNHATLTDKVVSVDSHAILHSIVERGFEDTIKELDGAFTLVWYDTKDKTLRLIRNHERPLFIANTDGAWIFASEKKMLEWIIDRENVKIIDITDAIPGRLYFFELDKRETMWYRKLTLLKPKKIQIIPSGTQTSNITKQLPALLTKKEAEDQMETSSLNLELPIIYNNTDFVIGTRIIIVNSFVIAFKTPDTDGNDKLVVGSWFFDSNVSIRCFTNGKELAKVTEPDDTETDILLSAEIKAVFSSKGKISLNCHKLQPVTTVWDSEGNEIVEDNFMFTNAKCSHCSAEVEFLDLEKGIFKYENPDDFEIKCSECCQKEDKQT